MSDRIDEKMHAFIEKYFDLFLTKSRIRNPFVEIEQFVKIPPTSQELEELITFLHQIGLDPVIVGTLAVMKHLVVTPDDIQTRIYRPIQTIDLLLPMIPQQLPQGWQVSKESSPTIFWASPSQGYIKFLKFEDEFPENQNVVKDIDSVESSCPVADVETIFKMNLNSRKERDIGDLMMLTKRFGFPKNIEKHLWNQMQRKNLEFLQAWAKLRVDKNQL